MPAKRKDEPQLGQWISTGVLLLFLLGVFIVGPERLPAYKQPVLTLIAATFAGFLGFFLSGKITLRLTAVSPRRPRRYPRTLAVKSPALVAVS